MRSTRRPARSSTRSPSAAARRSVWGVVGWHPRLGRERGHRRRLRGHGHRDTRSDRLRRILSRGRRLQRGRRRRRSSSPAIQRERSSNARSTPRRSQRAARRRRIPTSATASTLSRYASTTQARIPARRASTNGPSTRTRQRCRSIPRRRGPPPARRRRSAFMARLRMETTQRSATRAASTVPLRRCAPRRTRLTTCRLGLIR